MKAVEVFLISLLTDWHLTGTNAILSTGHIVNIDHSGNRVAAMLYGPERVIIIFTSSATAW
ncbi:LUD domain-containing protein [Halanaerobiaceae bacterium Z-7014]|uniref:LUD domain-containing protein n=1 Tax=Halonatronomonas betaini TaxID=2778430 RepID=A0A931AQY3_9FIRM|nr:LUD domain-containing protein [Halonatronomonas betaini]